MRVRLPESDRVRLGAPEVMDVDLTRISLSEALAIESATGLTPLGVLAGASAMHPRAWLAIVWLGLKRAGVQIGIGEIDLDNILEVRVEPSGDVSDPKSATPSGSPARRSATTTRRSSRSSGAGRPTRTGG